MTIILDRDRRRPIHIFCTLAVVWIYSCIVLFQSSLSAQKNNFSLGKVPRPFPLEDIPLSCPPLAHCFIAWLQKLLNHPAGSSATTLLVPRFASLGVAMNESYHKKNWTSTTPTPKPPAGYAEAWCLPALPYMLRCRLSLIFGNFTW